MAHTPTTLTNPDFANDYGDIGKNAITIQKRLIGNTGKHAEKICGM